MTAWDLAWSRPVPVVPDVTGLGSVQSQLETHLVAQLTRKKRRGKGGGYVENSSSFQCQFRSQQASFKRTTGTNIGVDQLTSRGRYGKTSVHIYICIFTQLYLTFFTNA